MGVDTHVCTKCSDPFTPSGPRAKRITRCDQCREYFRKRWAAKSEQYKRSRNTKEHREKCRNRNKKARENNNADLLTIFGDGKEYHCQSCSFHSPYKVQFDLHHTDPAKKSVSPTRALRNVGTDVKQLIRLEGLTLICTNCHHQRHGRGVSARGKFAWLASNSLDTCMHCNEKVNVECFHLHHLDPSEKTSKKNRKKALLDTETGNCAVLCARCHMLITNHPELAKEYPSIQDSMNVKAHQRIQREKYEDEDRRKYPQVFGRRCKEFTLEREDFKPEHRQFIERYEWLGTVGNSPRYTFCARIDNILAGVILFGNQYGKGNFLVLQRGACASFAHRNLSSRLIGFSLRWLKRNTDKSGVLAYSDPAAGEIGTVYAASNFTFCGWGYGTDFRYKNSEFREKEFSAQSLRRTATFIRWYREHHGSKPPEEWFKNGFKQVSKIPFEIIQEFYCWGNTIISEAETIRLPAKGKWQYSFDGSTPSKIKSGGVSFKPRWSMDSVSRIRAAKALLPNPV